MHVKHQVCKLSYTALRTIKSLTCSCVACINNIHMCVLSLTDANASGTARWRSTDWLNGRWPPCRWAWPVANNKEQPGPANGAIIAETDLDITVPTILSENRWTWFSWLRKSTQSWRAKKYHRTPPSKTVKRRYSTPGFGHIFSRYFKVNCILFGDGATEQ
jgi:hypothetical protein